MTRTHISKIALASLLCALLCAGMVLTGCTQGKSASKSSSAASQTSYMNGKHTAIMTVDGYDPITIELDADAAPITVTNFVDLVNKGFYDGLNFYRFVDDFCMQGGSSNNAAAVVNDGVKPIKGEFASNGVKNALADNFKEGTVAMARSSNPDSATSTFFITLGSASAVGPSLNGKYAAFGTIDAAGMKTIDAIVKDYLPNVDDPSMGSIADQSKQAKIKSITITD